MPLAAVLSLACVQGLAPPPMAFTSARVRATPQQDRRRHRQHVPDLSALLQLALQDWAFYEELLDA